MRTTLTLDDDVAALLRRAQQLRKARLKDIVNQALREGLANLITPRPRGKHYRIRAVNLGRCRLQNLDNSTEVLSLVEGEWFR